MTHFGCRRTPVLLVAALVWGGGVSAHQTAAAGASTEKTIRTPPPLAAPADTSLAAADSTALEARLVATRGRWLLLNLWATWCAPCVAETPELVALARELGDSLRVLGVSTDPLLVSEAESRVKVRAYRQRFAVPYPLLLYAGRSEELTTRFGFEGAIPVTLLYAPDGREAGRWERRLGAADLRLIRRRVRGR